MGKNSITVDENDFFLKITGSNTITEIKENTELFLRYLNENQSRCNILCKALMRSVAEYSAQCMWICTAADARITLVPPHYSPICLMTACIPVNGSAKVITAGLKKFIEKCAEFEEPKTKAISEEEMRFVLNAAQERYGYLDFVSPQRPFKILCFDNSHCLRNSECGIIGEGDDAEAVLFVYSPREIYDLCDNVFIFAHELGHALHLALTKDVNIIPKEYDRFNEALNVKMPEELKQEGFADAFAFALLGDDRLKEHLPNQFSLSPYFDEFFKILIKGYLNKRKTKK